MKHLNATGEYINKKQAQPITAEQESHLWDLRLLGDHNPQTLVNTIVFQVVLFLGAGMNTSSCPCSRHFPLQIQLYEPAGDRAYLQI